MREYNTRNVYDWFNNPFTVDFVRPSYSIYPMHIDYSSIPKKPGYNPDPLPSDIYIVYGNSVSTLNKPSDSPWDILPSYDSTSTDHTTMINKPGHAIYKEKYFSSIHEGIRCYRKSRL